ncbi:Hydroxymethylpyrimidine ABC transporter, ATPase component [Caldisalinibacter kiritimatiensis]|uniref:Hydroxymethylpyrimidine ABC transporter, ATPase component n=1 Tax=Caldisalinibacter kiritimatiensis TaxID=1304284 RepID=R1AYE5_9FIRM|nr:Hydroxymethylpyrimidine ABC transporter, ATPase component [Caldisalinibacter kiritimatiensis]
MVTHDIAEAISMADRVAVLSKRPATIKDIIPIKLTCPAGIRTPMKCREAPEFRHYFNKIWKELDVHV